MRATRPDRSRYRAARRYALLLRLYPRAHRQAFGEQMLQALADHYRDAVEAGRAFRTSGSAWWPTKARVCSASTSRHDETGSERDAFHANTKASPPGGPAPRAGL
jgi:hypothetical protein